MGVQAHEQIVECRRMLKWTYAFGYYQFDTAALPDEADVPAAEAAAAAAERRRLAEQKDFFEFLQCDAETSLELLSKAVEQDCRPFYGRAELLRTAKLKPGGEARAEVRSCAHSRILRLWSCSVHRAGYIVGDWVIVYCSPASCLGGHARVCARVWRRGQARAGALRGRVCHGGVWAAAAERDDADAKLEKDV